MKPRILLRLPRMEAEAPATETKLQRAARIYGKKFCQNPWKTGEGPRFWNEHRIAELSKENAQRREERARRSVS